MLQTIKGKLLLLLSVLVVGLFILGYEMVTLSSTGKETAVRWVQIKICTKTDTDSLSRLNSSFSLALNHSSSSSYINLLL